MSIARTLLPVAMGMAVVCTIPPGLQTAVHAGSATWTGQQGDQWKVNGNWDPPTTFPNNSSDVATFGASGQHSARVGAQAHDHVIVRSVVFAETSPGYTISSGGGQLRIADGGGVTVESGVATDQTFAVALRPLLGTTTYRNDGAGLLSFNQVQTDWDGTGNAHLVFTGSGDIRVNRLEDRTPPGHPTDPVRTLSLEKTGSGTLTVTGNSNFSGNVRVSGGVLNLQHSNALGVGSKTIDARGSSGAFTVELEGGITISDDIAWRTSNQSLASPNIRNVSGDNRILGQIGMEGLGGHTAVVVDAGTLELSDVTNSWDWVEGGLRNLIIAGAGAGTVSGIISDGTEAWQTSGVVKEGAGTWTLSGSNTYTGATVINAGTLRLAGGDNRLPTGTTVHFDGDGTLDLDGINQTIAQMTFDNGATASVTGGGSLNVDGAAHLQIGPQQTGNTGATSIDPVTLDMAGLAHFTHDAPAHFFRVGLRWPTEGAYASNITVATVTLADTNTITAEELRVADQTANSGGGHAFLYLGRENTIHADDVNVAAAGRSSATVEFAAGLADPSVTFRGTDGTSAVSAWNIARTNNWRNDTWEASVDLSAGTLDALVETMTIGNASNRHATAIGSFAMGAGTLDVTGTMTVGTVGGDGDGTRAGDGSFTLDGGAATVGTLRLAHSTATGGTTSTRGTLNVRDGSFTVGGPITLATGAATSEGTINLSGGTLKAQSIGAGAGTAAFDWTGGRLSVDHVGFDLLQTSTDGPSILAPGRSIGMTTIDGHYTMNTGTLEIEISGYDQGDQGWVGDAGDGIGYDFVMVDGNASLAGDLNVLLLDGFTAQLGDYFDVLQTTGSLDYTLDITGHEPNPIFGWWELGKVTGPGGDGFLLRLSAVPEPSTALLLALALTASMGFRRRRRRG